MNVQRSLFFFQVFFTLKLFVLFAICIISSTRCSRLFTIQVLHTLYTLRNWEHSLKIERFKRVNVLKMLMRSVYSRISRLWFTTKQIILFFCVCKSIQPYKRGDYTLQKYSSYIHN